MENLYRDELIKEMVATGDKLDPEFKAKWVAALRSGEYKKGVGRLYRPEKGEYCCLGVAAKLCGAEFDENGDTYFNAYGDIGSRKNDFGLSEITTHSLYRLNDSVFEASFLPLADVIEENL